MLWKLLKQEENYHKIKIIEVINLIYNIESDTLYFSFLPNPTLPIPKTFEVLMYQSIHRIPRARINVHVVKINVTTCLIIQYVGNAPLYMHVQMILYNVHDPVCWR